jgi:hypothetical protein
MQNNKNIHFFFEDEISTFTDSINQNLFKRRYPGVHFAVHFGRSNISSGFFDEILFINTDTFKKISQSPILGDEVVLNIIHKKLSHIIQEGFTWSFNLFGNKVCTTFQALLKAENFMGFNLQAQGEQCEDPSLRLMRLYMKLEKGNSLVTRSLLQKATKQFDQESFKALLAPTIDHKLNSQVSGTKKILIKNNTTSLSDEDLNIISIASKHFTVLSNSILDASDFMFDATLFSSGEQGINISSLDSEEAMAKISLSTVGSITKWFTRLIFAEYLGLSKTSFAFEKLIATYPKELLQEFMIAQLGELKDFVAQVILSERQRSQIIAIEAIKKHSRRLSPLSMTLAIHASQTNPSDADQAAKIDTLKNRLRNLNSLYERIYRLCSIDIPKSDLALTL